MEESVADVPKGLIDFVYGVDKDNPLTLKVGVNEAGKVTVFHNKVFKDEVAWFEFDLQDRRLNFVLDDGDVRDIGLPIDPALTKYMHNSHQVLMVLVDQENEESREGKYVPLIIHGA